MYDNDYFFYMGYAYGHELPNIQPADNIFQWAIVNNKNKVIGWFAYRIQPETDTAYNFGFYSFDRGNPIIGRDIFKKMEDLVKEHHRVEWRMIGDNPVQKHYDKFCEKHNGNRVHLHQVCKDTHGQYHDEYIYEIVKNSTALI